MKKLVSFLKLCINMEVWFNDEHSKEKVRAARTWCGQVVKMLIDIFPHDKQEWHLPKMSGLTNIQIFASCVVLKWYETIVFQMTAGAVARLGSAHFINTKPCSPPQASKLVRRVHCLYNRHGRRSATFWYMDGHKEGQNMPCRPRLSINHFDPFNRSLVDQILPLLGVHR